LQRVFPEPQRETIAPNRYGRAVARIRQYRQWATQRFEEGAGQHLKGVPGTLWAADNGVTEMVEHHGVKSTPEQHLLDI